MIVLMIPTQALCFAQLYNQSFREMLAGLMGAGSDATPFPVTLLGCLFAAIVISMIISTFPTETVKKHNKPRIFVIGCGDVVKERVYGALIDSKCGREVKCYDLRSAKAEKTDGNEDDAKKLKEKCIYLDNEEQICQHIDARLESSSVVWMMPAWNPPVLCGSKHHPSLIFPI